MKYRISIRKNDDPSKDLEIASSLRRDLWAHSPLDIDPNDSAVATRRSGDRTAFFEFDTDFPRTVIDEVIQRYGYSDYIDITNPDAKSSLAPS